ncbi:tyrosine-protein phosphatase [Lacticaseibacillus mingshuiensis]|uniref:Tyrosine-protein phosphatase n=1 Tax=Lacticaseibacillus mingshuiensis TaxID=2799574 RepID=A0ABW4CHV0_9LACO|nr:tyrosine-protein phosphatase [Lacticaseibacillus mingshuiensis]
MIASERLLAVPHAVNLRELGGYPTENGQQIRWRKVLRSGTLFDLTPADGQLLVDYGVVKVIDLRSDSETTAMPDRLPRQIAFQQAAVYPFTDQPSPWAKLARRVKAKFVAPYDLMLETYLKMLTDSHAIAAFRAVFAALLANTQPDQAVLFHCMAGKDRTGMAALMIEGALGVPEPILREDYLLTNLVLARQNAVTNDELRHGGSALVNEMNRYQAETTNYQAVHDLVQRRFGSWREYVEKAVGLSRQDLADLDRLYLEDL